MSDRFSKFTKLAHEYNSRATQLILVNTPGMRMIKTTLAVLICLLIDWFRSSPTPYTASIAAIVCMQQDLATTWQSSRNRLMGTTIAGVYAFLFLLLFGFRLNLDLNGLPYYILVAIFILPLMQMLVSLKLPGSVANSAIVFLLICLSSGGTTDPLGYSIMRVTDTFIGIIVAMLINWLPFLNSLGRRLENEKNQAREKRNHSDKE